MSRQLDMGFEAITDPEDRGWTSVPLGELAELCLGKMLDKAKNKGELRPYLRNINVRWGSFDLVDVQEMRFEPHEFERYTVVSGDVVMCEGGEPGRCAVWKSSERFYLQKALHRIRCNTKVLNPDFLTYQIQLLAANGDLARRFTGSTIKHLPGRVLAAVPIKIAPPSEQHRIVAEIEKQFTRLDAVVASLERVKANLKRARASVLKAAVEGRLVPTEAELARAEGRDYEPASVLLERILAERKRKHAAAQEGAKRKKKYKQPVEPDTEGLPELPEGWTWACIEQLSSSQPRSIQSGPFGSNLRHSEFTEDGFLVIGIDNVRDGVFSMGAENRISETKFRALEKFRARPLDVLITVMATVGRCCVVPKEIEPSIITKHVYRLTVDQRAVLPHYLMYMLKGAPPVRVQMFQEARGQTRLGLNGTIVKQLAIPLPPASEQVRIVGEIERRYSIMDMLDGIASTNSARCVRLRHSLLKRAFEGKLVPQDPNDEPASELLVRIAEVASTKPTRTKTKSVVKEAAKKRARRKKTTT